MGIFLTTRPHSRSKLTLGDGQAGQVLEDRPRPPAPQTGVSSSGRAHQITWAPGFSSSQLLRGATDPGTSRCKARFVGCLTDSRESSLWVSVSVWARPLGRGGQVAARGRPCHLARCRHCKTDQALCMLALCPAGKEASTWYPSVRTQELGEYRNAAHRGNSERTWAGGEVVPIRRLTPCQLSASL